MESTSWRVSKCSIEKVNLLDAAILAAGFGLTENSLFGTGLVIGIVRRMYEIRVNSIAQTLVTITWQIHSDILTVTLISRFSEIFEQTEAQLRHIQTSIGFRFLPTK